MKNVNNNILPITDTLRLKPHSDDVNEEAFKAYQDPELNRLVNGPDSKLMDPETIGSMFSFFHQRGECYIIEVFEEGQWKPIGDAALTPDTIPIVIWFKEYRGRGIGRKVIIRLIERAKELGYERVKVKEIYDYNAGSLKLFTSLGFVKTGRTDKGVSMEFKIS